MLPERAAWRHGRPIEGEPQHAGPADEPHGKSRAPTISSNPLPFTIDVSLFFLRPVVSSCKASRQAPYLATETCAGAVVRSTRQFSSLFNNAAPSLTLTSLPGTSVYEPQRGPH